MSDFDKKLEEIQRRIYIKLREDVDTDHIEGINAIDKEMAQIKDLIKQEIIGEDEDTYGINYGRKYGHNQLRAEQRAKLE